MSILINKNLEKEDFIDYTFICDVFAKDPRYKSRNICIGQNKGLFRISKKTLEPELLLPMDGDKNGQRYIRALSKVLKEYKNNNEFPNQTHFAAG